MAKADKILKGGTFYCGGNLSNDIDFVAVSGNKILATGKESEMSQYVDDTTEILEFPKDNLIMAGIHDNHIHLTQAGILCKYVQLFAERSKEACGEKVREFAKTIPDEPWILGVGYRKFIWDVPEYPTAKDMDKYVSDRPVFLLDDELHGAWLNSLALEKCGITKDSVVPAGGVMTRNEDGTPAGVLVDSAISMAKAALDFAPEVAKDLINRYVDFAVELGITSVSDMAPYLEMDLSYPDVHLDMAEKGESRIRVNVARNLFEDMDVYKKHQKEAAERGQGMYTVTYMKQFLDGTPGNYTGWMLEGYSDNPSEKGRPTLDVEKMKEHVKIATKNNVSVRLHSCGDASCRAAMDAYEAAIKMYPDNTCRHMIEHLEVVNPAEIPRFGKLGVIASIQAEHAATWPVNSDDEIYPDVLGDRYFYSWPFKSIKDAGGMLASGSDCPVVEGNPYYGIFAGLTRKYADLKIPRGGNPGEKLSIEEMLDSYTIGAAYAEHREDELGTLEAGKLADITVVNCNLLEMAKTEDPAIRDAKAALTMVNGKVVYSEK